MPNSCKAILDRMVHKGAMSEAERDKILRNIKTEIVRCGECKYFDKDECCSKNGIMIWDLDWFCADGERREDG